MQRPASFFQGQRKPWVGRPRLNWSHPLAHGLSTYCYDWNGQIIDLVNHGPHATLVGASGRKGSVAGFGQKIPLAGFAYLPPLPAGKFLPFGGAAPYSAWLATVYTGLTNTSGNPDPDGVIVSIQDAGNSLNTAFGFNCWSAGTHLPFDAVAGLYNNNLNSWYNTPIALNKFQTWGVSAPTTTTANQYASGVFDSTFSNTTTSSAVSNCQIMYNTAQNNLQSFGQAVLGFVHAFAMWYPRVLTPADWQELQVRPWNPYRIPLLIFPEDEILTRRLRGPASAAPASSFLPSLPLTGVG